MLSDDDSKSVEWGNNSKTSKQAPKSKKQPKPTKEAKKRKRKDNEDLDNPDIREAIEAFGDLDVMVDEDDDDDEASDEEVHDSIPTSASASTKPIQKDIEAEKPDIMRPISRARIEMEEVEEENRKKEEERLAAEEQAEKEEDDDDDDKDSGHDSMVQSAVNSTEQAKRDAKFLKEQSDKAGAGKKKGKKGEGKGIIPTVPSADAPLPESAKAPLPEEIFFDEDGCHYVTKADDEKEQPKKKVKSAFKLAFVGDTLMTEFARKTLLARKNKVKLNADSITPKSEPILLHRLSNERLREEKLDISTKARAISHECELIALSGEMRDGTNVNDLRRLLRFYDDFALEKRVTDYGQTTFFDKAHQLSLFICRMKIINTLYNVLVPKLAAEEVDTGEDRYIQNEYWREAELITEYDLAQWMYTNEVCSQRMLVVSNDERTNEVIVHGHVIHNSTLETFWRSLQYFMAAWPRLKFSGYLIRYFNEMRRRCAFFISYCENLNTNPSGSSVKATSDRNESLILD